MNKKEDHSAFFFKNCVSFYFHKLFNLLINTVALLTSPLAAPPEALMEDSLNTKEGKPMASVAKLTLNDTTVVPEWTKMLKIAQFLGRSATLYGKSFEITLHFNCSKTEAVPTR